MITANTTVMDENGKQIPMVFSIVISGAMKQRYQVNIMRFTDDKGLSATTETFPLIYAELHSARCIIQVDTNKGEK